MGGQLDRMIHRAAPATKAERPSGHSADVGQPNILVVEDNVTNQFVFSHFLRKIGMPFDMAPNGAEALVAWESGDYDVVLMDIEMPVMDGIEATRELRRREVALDRPPTPIIALSADAMLENREKALQCGMDDFLTKPVELDRLRKTIWQVLGRPAAPASAGGFAAPARLRA
jgi:CheY-like chemotaxis protein